MGSTRTNKNKLPPGCFLLGSHLISSLFLISRYSLEYYGKTSKSSFLAIFYIDIKIRDFIKF